MLDEPEETGGTINWPMAIAISVVVHAVILGLFWLLAGPKSPPAGTPETGTDQPPPAAAPMPPVEPVPPVVEPSPTTPPAPPTPSANPSTPSTVEAPHPASPTAAPAVETTSYTVKKGDYLSRIANKHGCTVVELEKLNGSLKNKMLHPGDIIQVPVKQP